MLKRSIGTMEWVVRAFDRDSNPARCGRVVVAVRRLGIVAIAVLLLGSSLHGSAAAAICTWQDTGTVWNIGSNWGGTPPGSGDIGLFNLNSTYLYQPALSAAASVGGLRDTGSGSLTVSGSTLTLNSATINGNAAAGIEMDAGAGPWTIGTPLALGGPQAWLNNSGSLLTVSGNVANGGYALTLAGSGNTTLSGLLSGSGGLVQSGPGLLLLSGSAANSYTGATQVSGGALALSMSNMAAPTNLVNAGSALILSGGSLLLDGAAAGTSSQTFNGTTVAAGASAVTVANNGGSGTTLALGAIGRSEGGTVNFTLPGGRGAITTTASNTNGILGGWATVGGTDWAAVNGGSIAVVGSYASTWGSGANVTVSGTLSYAYGDPNSVRFNTANTQVSLYPRLTTIQSGGILVTNAGYGAYLSGGSLTSGASDLVIQVPGPGSQITINSPIVDNGLSSVGLTVSGSGTVTLFNSDTFSGPITLNSGTLVANALSGQSVTMGPGSSLQAYGYALTLGALAGSGTLAGYQGRSSAMIFGSNNAATTFSGVVGQGTYLTDVGTGVFTFSGSNSGTAGRTILNGGSLVLNYSTNTGPKCASGANGGLAIAGGTVQIVPNPAAASLVVGGAVEAAGPGALIDSTLDPNPVAGLGGGSTLAVANVAGSASIALGTLTRDFGAALNFVVPANYAGHLTTSSSNSNGILGGWATYNGVDWAASSASSGTGNIVAYTGYLPFAAGNASVTGNYLLNGGGALTLSETMNSLKLTDTGRGQGLNLGANNLSIMGNATSYGTYGGAILYAGGTSNTYTISGSGLLLCGSNAFTSQPELLVNAATGGTLTVAAPVGGSTALTKAGGGTVVLAASNSYTGSTCIDAGTLQLANSTALGNPAGSSIAICPGSTLDLNGYAWPATTYVVGLIGSGVGGVGALINSSTRAATMNSPNGYVTLDGNTTVGGAGDINLGSLTEFEWGNNTLTKIGSDTFSVATAAYSNGASSLVINGGRFQCQAGGVVPATTAVQVNPGTTFDLNGYSDEINLLNLNNGTVTLGSGSGAALIIYGPWQYTGTAGSPAITATGTSAISGSNGASLVIAAGAVDVVNAGDALTIGCVVSSQSYTTAITKTGSGLLALTASNTYTGPTTVNQGTLLVNGSLVSPVTVNSGGMLGGSGSLTSVTVASGGSLSPGAAPSPMTVSGSLSLLSGAKMDYALDTPSG